MALFSLFKKLDIRKKGLGYHWILTGDQVMMALALTMQDAPQMARIGFQRKYTKRYDWLARQFMSLAVSFYSSFLYYK